MRTIHDRQIWIDVYKGIAIILVILGHLEIPKGLYDFIFLFHMYAFFFISGVTFKVKSEVPFGAFLLDNLKMLYIPYLFFAFAWDIVNIVTTLYIQGTFDLSLESICKNVLSVFIGGDVFKSTANIGPAWFLLALFVVRMVCWLIVKFTKDNRYLFGAVSIVLFIFRYIFQDIPSLPFKINTTLTVFVFVFLGYCLKNVRNLIQNWKCTALLVVALLNFGIVAVVSFFTDKTVVLVGNVLPTNFVYTIIGGICGCAGLLFLSLLLERTPKVSDLLAFYGMNSLVIMGIHSEINFAFRFVFDKIGVGHVFRVLIIFVMTLLLSIPACKIIDQYFPILAGRRKCKV